MVATPYVCGFHLKRYRNNKGVCLSWCVCEREKVRCVFHREREKERLQ